MAQTGKRLSTVRETWVPSLGWEDPLEKEMATHSSTLINMGKLWEIVEDRGGWCAAVYWVTKSQTQFGD